MAKIPPFHTDTDDYRPEDKLVYHDDTECDYGKRIMEDGNAKPGTAGRRRCERCDSLAAA